jgi:hypothetical protein
MHESNEHSGPSRVLAFRAPLEIVRAIEAEAHNRFCSMSDVARELVVCDLRRRGLLE